jgi:hypothetical protein
LLPYFAIAAAAAAAAAAEEKTVKFSRKLFCVFHAASAANYSEWRKTFSAFPFYARRLNDIAAAATRGSTQERKGGNENNGGKNDDNAVISCCSCLRSIQRAISFFI